MKTYISCHSAILAAATFVLPMASVQTSNAQTNTNLFPAKVKLVCTSTNQAGGLVYERVTTSDFVEECATEMGVSNLTELSLVFNRSNSSLEVVSGTNQTVLCTPLSFDGGVSLANSNNTRVHWQTFVFVGTNATASGMLTATEGLAWGTSNQLTSFGLSGLLSYSFTNGTNSPAICRGILLVGTAMAHDDDDNDDDDDDGKHGKHGKNGKHGNNGHHGDGNCGNNGNHNGSHGTSGKGRP